MSAINFKCLTVYTDASYCPKTKAVGLGAWARDYTGSESWDYGVHGVDVVGSHEAEVMAAAFGFLKAVHHFDFKKGLVVLVVDCAAVGPHFMTGPVHQSPNCLKAYARVAKVMEQRGLTLKVNKVAAHKNPTKCRRFWVNNEVDRMARKAMETIRKGVSS